MVICITAGLAINQRALNHISTLKVTLMYGIVYYWLPLVFFSFVIIAPLAHADELFVPSDMLISEQYTGIYIRDDSKKPQIITLASDSDIITIPDSLYFAPDQNHALFNVTLHGLGDATIIAHGNGMFYNATTSVTTDQKKDYNIFLLIPEKTSTSNVQGMIFLVDDFFNPVYLDRDILVRFATQNIDAPKQLKIAARNSFAIFSANIAGDGTIAAYTDQSASDIISVDFSMAQKQVHIGVAPNIIAPYSFSYLFVWITEDGMPLHPALPIKSSVHVSDSNIIGIDGSIFTPTITPGGTSETVYLREGVLMKKLASNEPGVASITVNVPGYGTASKLVTTREMPSVGYGISKQHTTMNNKCNTGQADTRYTDCDSESLGHTSQRQHANDPMTNNTSDTTTLVANVYPTITSEHAYLVWSLYKEVNSRLYPAYGNAGTDFFATSQNLTHEKIIPFENDQRKTQSQIIPVSGSIIGNHTISVSSTATLDTVTAELEIAAPAKYEISIQSLPPIDTKDYRPLFAVSVLDSDGYTVDPHQTFGDLEVTLLSDDIQFASKTIYLDKAVNIIKGRTVVSYPSITILANDKDIMSYSSYKPTSKLGVDIQLPKKVHSGEEFPAYAFLVDSDKRPISDLSRYLQSKCDTSNDVTLFLCHADSEFLLFENTIGFAVKDIPVFENQFEDNEISFEFADDAHSVGVGSKSIISFEIPHNAAIDVVTSIPHIVNHDSIVLMPDTVGSHNITFLVSKQGFETHQSSISYHIHDRIALDIQSITTGGISVPSSISISQNNQTILADTPEIVDILRGHVHLEFEPSIIIDSAGYSFDHVEILKSSDNPNSTATSISYDEPTIDLLLLLPTSVFVTYEQVINIAAGNARGGGVYKYGETVTLVAPPRDIASFLIRDVFDYWEYLPLGYDVYSDTLQMTATESFATRAIYRADYSGLVQSIIVIALVIAAFIKKEEIVATIQRYRNKT